MPRLLLTRPEAQNQEWQELLAAQGIASIASPLLSIRPLPASEEPIREDEYEGVIITSRHALVKNTLSKTLDFYVVGEQIAEEARRQGFRRVRHVAPTAGALAGHLRRQPFSKPLLYLTGVITREDMQTLLAPGIAVHRRVVYEAIPADNLTAEARSGIIKGEVDGALFFSPRSADIFHTLAGQAGLTAHLAHMAAFCLSRDIAARCAAGRWKNIHSATRPDRDSLLSLIRTQYRN